MIWNKLKIKSRDNRVGCSSKRIEKSIQEHPSTKVVDSNAGHTAINLSIFTKG